MSVSRLSDTDAYSPVQRAIAGKKLSARGFRWRRNARPKSRHPRLPGERKRVRSRFLFSQPWFVSLSLSGSPVSCRSRPRDRQAEQSAVQSIGHRIAAPIAPKRNATSASMPTPIQLDITQESLSDPPRDRRGTTRGTTAGPVESRVEEESHRSRLPARATQPENSETTPRRSGAPHQANISGYVDAFNTATDWYQIVTTTLRDVTRTGVSGTTLVPRDPSVETRGAAP
jgi:hypothetical protein